MSMATATATATAASPNDSEATVAVHEGLMKNLPKDTFVEILLRLPPICRRWARLVCRHWRDVIDERTPRSEPPKVLACFTSSKSVSAYVVDDLAYGRCREVWRLDRGRARDSYLDMAAVGTCNGLLCLFDNRKKPGDGDGDGGAIFLVNPVTGETLRLPPPPAPYQRHSYGPYGDKYSFGWHPATGQYKVVCLSCGSGGEEAGQFDALQVFTLGTASWRAVAVPGASCCLDAGVVTAGGATHWVTKDVERVVSFDLEDERVAFAAALPVGAAGPGFRCRLVEFHGRLGPAVSADRQTPAKIEVWVLGDGGGGGRQGWTRRYSVRVQGVEQRLAEPYFAHGGEYVLTVPSTGQDWERKHVHAHRLRELDAGRLPSGEVRSVRITEPGTLVAYCKDGSYLRTFSYVPTREPLSVYKINDHRPKVHPQRKWRR